MRIFFLEVLEGRPVKKRRKLILEMHRLLGPEENSPPPGMKFKLPNYKFYTELIERLLHSSRSYGIPRSKILQEIKGALHQDDRFEKKLSGEFTGHLLQFALVTLATWIFVFFSISSSFFPSSSFPKMMLVKMLCGQVLGPILYGVIFIKGKQRMESPFALWLAGLYSFPALMAVGVPLSQALTDSQLNRVFAVTTSQSDFIFLLQRLRVTLENLQTKGGPLQKEFEEMVHEIWFLLEEAHEKFLKQLQVLKLFILTVFFLSAYFSFILSLLESLVGEEVFPSTF